MKHPLIDSLDRAQRAQEQARDRALAPHGLSAVRFDVLDAIGDLKGGTPSQVSAATGRSPNAISPLLKAMEAGGLISRGPNANDARSHLVRLTATGRRVLQRARRADAAAARALEAGAPRTLVGHLDRIRTNASGAAAKR